MRIKDFFTFALILFCPIPAKADTPAPQLKPNGYQQITSLSSASSLTVPTYSTAAIVCVETANVRWRDDGTAPTTTVGMPVAAGQCFAYTGSLSAIQFIAQSGSPVVNVAYYR